MDPQKYQEIINFLRSEVDSVRKWPSFINQMKNPTRKLQAKRNYRASVSKFVIHTGKLVLSEDPAVQVVTEPEKLDVMRSCHDGIAHGGITNTWKKVSARWWWKRFYKDVENYVKNCTCQAKKRLAKRRKAIKAVITEPHQSGVDGTNAQFNVPAGQIAPTSTSMATTTVENYDSAKSKHSLGKRNAPATMIPLGNKKSNTSTTAGIQPKVTRSQTGRNSTQPVQTGPVRIVTISSKDDVYPMQIQHGPVPTALPSTSSFNREVSPGDVQSALIQDENRRRRESQSESEEAASPVTPIDVSINEDSSGAEDSSSKGVSDGVDNHSIPQMYRPSLPAVVNFFEGKTAESSTQNSCSPNASGAVASTRPITSNANGIGQSTVDSNEVQTEVSQRSFETLRLISTLAETQQELANTQAELKTSQLVAEKLWSASTLYENQLQQAKTEAEAKTTQLQLKCDRLEAQCKALTEQLEEERKSHQNIVDSHQKENTNLCDRTAGLQVELIELKNRLEQRQKQQPNDQNSVGNRDQLKLKSRLKNRYIEEQLKDEGNAQSSTVSTPPESSQPTADGQQIDQSATDVVKMES